MRFSLFVTWAAAEKKKERKTNSFLFRLVFFRPFPFKTSTPRGYRSSSASVPVIDTLVARILRSRPSISTCITCR